VATGARSLAGHARISLARLGPRLSNLSRTAAMFAVAVGYLCVLCLMAAAAWVAPRLRASAQAAVWAALTLGVAATGAVHLIGTRLSNHLP
jgi:hypothetical protein